MLTYEGNENRECRNGNGVYEFNLHGHYVRMNVWPKAAHAKGEPTISIDLMNGSTEEPIFHEDIDDPADHLLEEALLFHEAVVRAIVHEEEAFQDFLMVPLGHRLAEGMAQYIHQHGLAKNGQKGAPP